MNVFESNRRVGDFVQHDSQDLPETAKPRAVLRGSRAQVELNVGGRRVGIAAAVSRAAADPGGARRLDQSLDAPAPRPEHGIHVTRDGCQQRTRHFGPIAIVKDFDGPHAAVLTVREVVDHRCSRRWESLTSTYITPAPADDVNGFLCFIRQCALFQSFLGLFDISTGFPKSLGCLLLRDRRKV